jgi:tetratricopeptide (TPR) repeat protein
MQRILTCIFIFLFVCVVKIYPQKRVIDSLEKVLAITTNDTVKIKTLHRLGWKLKDTEPDKAKGYLKHILAICESVKNTNDKEHLKFFTRYKANAHLITGLIYTRQGNYASALQEQEIAMDLGTQYNEIPIMADAACNIGIVHYMQGNFPKALENYLKAMRFSEKGTDKKRIANLSNNIGGIYIQMHDTARAWEFFSKAMKMNKEINNRTGIGNCYANLGLILKNRKKLDEALDYMHKALSYALEVDDKEKEAACYDNISNIYFLKNKLDSSLVYNTKSIEIYKYIEDMEGLGSAYANMSSTYLKLKKYDKTLDLLLQAEVIGKDISSKYMLKDVEQQLAEIYELKGKNEEAFESYKLYIIYKDSLSNEENTKKMVQAEMQYEFDKKEAITKAEQEKKEAIAAADSRKQKIIIWSVCGILILVFGFAVFAYRSFLQKKKANKEITAQKHIIEEKQKEILDSIYYARRIQRALLPTDKYIARLLTRKRD